MKAMGKTICNNEELFLGQQNFRNGTIEVIYKGKTIICDMFQDDEGDIFFLFNGCKIYFWCDVEML